MDCSLYNILCILMYTMHSMGAVFGRFDGYEQYSYTVMEMKEDYEIRKYHQVTLGFVSSDTSVILDANNLCLSFSVFLPLCLSLSLSLLHLPHFHTHPFSVSPSNLLLRQFRFV